MTDALYCGAGTGRHIQVGEMMAETLPIFNPAAERGQDDDTPVRCPNTGLGE